MSSIPLVKHENLIHHSAMKDYKQNEYKNGNQHRAILQQFRFKGMIKFIETKAKNFHSVLSRASL